MVYKPRDVRLEDFITGKQPNSLFQLVNSANKKNLLTTYQFLSKEKDGYGYTEFLSNDFEFNLDEMKKILLHDGSYAGYCYYIWN